MELKRTRKAFYFLVSTLLIMVLLLGSWWLFLVFKLANKLQDLHIPLLQGNLVSMIKWEGATFIVLLLCLTITLVYIYIQDHKKSLSLQAFFASLTHELKTPLASMKLQAEVLDEKINDLDNLKEQSSLLKYTQRIANDALRLEDQIDNHLQLSRVEREAPLNMRTINLIQFIKSHAIRYKNLIEIEINISKDVFISGDDFALQIVFRNLIENAIIHCAEERPILIITQESKPNEIKVSSNGQDFTGDLNKLGTIFYKHNSPKGTGIGLYLIKNLMRQMNGKLIIERDKKLFFTLIFTEAMEQN